MNMRNIARSTGAFFETILSRYIWTPAPKGAHEGRTFVAILKYIRRMLRVCQ